MYNAGMLASFPDFVRVTDQEIDLSSLSEVQQEHYRALATRVLDLYQRSGKARMVVGFAGQSGSGKSVTVEILRALLADGPSDLRVYTADIDAFHFSNAYLDTTTDNEGTILRGVKGRYDTYNVSLLERTLTQFVAGESVILPHYSRKIHDTVAEGQQVEAGPALLLLAGLWLLRDTPDWREIRTHIDYTYLIEGDTARVREHSVVRHMRGGKTREEAEFFYDTSDLQNAHEIAIGSVCPNEVVPFFENVVSTRKA